MGAPDSSSTRSARPCATLAAERATCVAVSAASAVRLGAVSAPGRVSSRSRSAEEGPRGGGAPLPPPVTSWWVQSVYRCGCTEEEVRVEAFEKVCDSLVACVQRGLRTLNAIPSLYDTMPHLPRAVLHVSEPQLHAPQRHQRQRHMQRHLPHQVGQSSCCRLLQC